MGPRTGLRAPGRGTAAAPAAPAAVSGVKTADQHRRRPTRGGGDVYVCTEYAHKAAAIRWAGMPKKTKEDLWQQDKGVSQGGAARPSGRRHLPKGNVKFDEFYKRQRIVESDAEWAEFMAAALTSLPACFRITSGRYAAGIRARLAADDAWGLEGLQAPDGVTDDSVFTVHPPQPVEWLPPGYAWSINAPRPVIRKCPQLKAFHQWLVMQNGQGNINRQEAVSMIPPLLLDVRPGMTVLDLCAAPGSKTAQLVDFLQADDPHARDRGLVVANDSDTSRCYMLVHQLKRFAGDSIVVTNHMGQNFPLLRTGSGEDKTVGMQFDRVLCDVPCSGDGTMRKSPDVWMKWKSGTGLGMHSLQVSILVRGIELCAVGGRVVYSTCSLNPYENEAVVAEAVRRFGGKVVVEDVSSELPQLKRKPGLETWGVRDPNNPVWYESAEDVPKAQRSKIPSSIWPPSNADEAAALGLSRTLRLLPHLQDTGGFFVCVLSKREALLKGHDYSLGSEAEPDKQRQSHRTEPSAPKGKRQRHQGYDSTEAPATVGASTEATAVPSNAAGADDGCVHAVPDGIQHSQPQVAGGAVATAPKQTAAKAGAEPLEKVKGPRGREMDPRELIFEAAIAERNNAALTKSITDLGPHYGPCPVADFRFGTFGLYANVCPVYSVAYYVTIGLQLMMKHLT